jgi:c-di-GMP phosphodiesterase
VATPALFSGQEHGPSNTAEAENLRYVARQPILDARGNVYGYELLYRASPETTVFSGDGDLATRTVLDNTLIFGLETLTGGLPVFVNCTREALMDRLVTVLPPQQTVLEILETLEPSEELLHACTALKAAGYRIAMDDFVWSADWEPFLTIANYIKVDMSVVPAEDRLQLIEQLRPYPARLVAERVETQEDFAQVCNEGFTLFQGYYFCRPVLMKNRDIPANRFVQFELLQALRAEPLDTNRVSELVKQDAALTYRLLKVVNSALYTNTREIRSIHAALVVVGDEMFRRIAIMAIAAELAGKQPMELVRMAFVRARFCELVAKLTGRDPMEQYLLGLFSLLPALLRLPMAQLASTLPLREEIRGALLGAINSERSVLAWLEHYESGLWEHCDRACSEAGLPRMQLPHFYADSVAWAEDALSLPGLPRTPPKSGSRPA